MKRIIFAALLAVAALPTRAQDAEKQDDIKRLNTDVESLIAANARLQKELSALTSTVQGVREESAAAAGKNNVQDELRRLAEKIQEVDRKREADKQLILDKLAEFGRLLSAAPSGRSPRPSIASRETNSSPGVESARPDKPPVSDKGYEHVVEKGEFLSTIVHAYNEKFKEKGMKTLSIQQVVDANPNLKPERMRVGQKIFIPMPQ
jgi:hypothetical protein